MGKSKTRAYRPKIKSNQRIRALHWGNIVFNFKYFPKSCNSNSYNTKSVFSCDYLSSVYWVRGIITGSNSIKSSAVDTHFDMSV